MSSSHPAFLSGENISEKVRFTACTLVETKLNKISVAKTGRRRDRVQFQAQGGDQLMLSHRRTGGLCLLRGLLEAAAKVGSEVQFEGNASHQ